MIGNDVVDLALAQKESNWQRKGFLDKIFTEKEQVQIKAFQNPDIMVWNLWSRKEAAYKIYNRNTNIRKYNPIQFECFNLHKKNEIIYGIVKYESQEYFTKTETSEEYIYSIAVTQEELFEKIKQISKPKIIIKKKGTPSYFDTDNNTIKPLSITHHGKFEFVISIDV